MSNVARRPNRTPRRAREKRAYQLVVVGAIASVVAVVGFVVALISPSFGAAIPFLAAIVAAVCFVVFRQMVRPR